MNESPLFKSFKEGVPNVPQPPFDISNLGYHPRTPSDDSPSEATTPSASDVTSPNGNQPSGEDKLASQQNKACAFPDAHRDNLTSTANQPLLPTNLLQLMKLVSSPSNLRLYNRAKRLAYSTYFTRNLILPTPSETPYHDKSSAVEDLEEWVDVKIVLD